MSLPLLHYTRVAWLQLVQPRLWRWQCSIVPPVPSAQKLMALCGMPSASDADFIAQFHRDAHTRLLFSPERNTPEFRTVLTSVLPTHTIIEQAESALNNRFAIFSRTPTAFGNTIQWHKDYSSGYEWERERYDRIDILRGKGSDMKFPCEVSKFHRVHWLGMASWLTNDDRYAHKFASEIRDWIQHNPVNIGINWTVSLEVAIRAVNWIHGYAFFAASPALDAPFWLSFLSVLYAHGLFLENNLEFVRVPGNHFACNCLGLVALGSLFSQTAAGRRWLRKGHAFLEQQIVLQNTPDGVNFEKSVPYHRFVTEIYTLGLLYAEKAGMPVSQEYRSRLEAMYHYMAAYTRPDGSAPMIGDADNGRILRFRAEEDFNTHVDNLAVGAALFGSPELAHERMPVSPDSLFTVGLPHTPPQQHRSMATQQPAQRHFRDGGYIVHRSAHHHCIIDVGNYGKNGRGGHGHNDCLSFELWACGAVLISDSGTGVYTANRELRDSLRSTHAHNTVMYAQAEQVEYAGVWQIARDTTQPTIVELTMDEHSLHLVVEQHGYVERVGAIHRREVRLHVPDAISGSMEIRDTILNAPPERGVSLYHIPPQVSLTQTTDTHCTGGTQAVEFTLHSDQSLHVQQAPYSPLYGVVEHCTEVVIPCDNTTVLRWKSTA